MGYIVGDKVKTVIEFGEELEILTKPCLDPETRYKWQKKHPAVGELFCSLHRLTGPAYSWKSGGVLEQKYVVDGKMVSEESYPEAVKAYKLKHGIPLDVGPDWKPGEVKNEEPEAPTVAETLAADVAETLAGNTELRKYLSDRIMHLDGKVAGLMERLNELEAKKPAKPAPPKHKTLEEVINAKPDDEGVTIRIYPGGNGGFVTELPDCPGCMSSGDTVLEALFGITWAYKDWANED
jgi:hypothetical protein